MANTTQKRGLSQRFHNWLDEPEGQIFTRGKWKFWWPTVTGFTLLNALLTAMIFRDGGQLQNYMGAVLVGVGGLVAWICVGALHYSDARDRKLALGVSALDSITLIFVVAHFSFLLWTYGHLRTLQRAERDYKAEVEKYNADARQVQADNAKIADSLRQIAEAEKTRAKIENDTMYQARKAAQAGARIETKRGSGLAVTLSTSPVELAQPPKAPADSSADFLTRWDALIRILNCGELLLAIATLIFIRNRSAAVNSPATYQPQSDQGEDWPEEVETDITRDDRIGRRFDRTRNSDSRRLSPDRAISTDRKEALNALRAHLKAIAFYCPGFWFRADLIDGGVSIRMFRRRQGIEETVASTRQSDKLLTAVNRPDFRERLVDELTRQAFPIEKHDAPT